MNIEHHWPKIRETFYKGLKTSNHVTLATINKDGTPHTAPLGSLCLSKDEPKGFYCDKYFTTTSRNLENRQRLSMLAVNSGFWFWLKSLYKGKFKAPPGVRLYGYAGEKRKITSSEQEYWERRIKHAKWTKGYDLLWKGLDIVRDVYFDSFEPINTGSMTTNAWK